MKKKKKFQWMFLLFILHASYIFGSALRYRTRIVDITHGLLSRNLRYRTISCKLSLRFIFSSLVGLFCSTVILYIYEFLHKWTADTPFAARTWYIHIMLCVMPCAYTVSCSRILGVYRVAIYLCVDMIVCARIHEAHSSYFSVLEVSLLFPG